MQENLDFYEFLDIDRSANIEEIRRAYIALALKWHPDKNLIGKKRAEKAFLEINEAYAVLSDEELRGIYDNEGPEEVKNKCTKYDLRDFKLEEAMKIFDSVYRHRDPIRVCLEDANWYENSDIFTGGLVKSLSHERFRNKLDVETEVIETSMSRYTTSPRNIEKSVKTVTIERGGRRVQKKITTITRADGSQETVEEEKEEPLSRATHKDKEVV